MLLNQEYFPSEEKEVVSNLWDNPPQQVISVPSYIVNSFPLIFKCNTHQARRAISYLREDRGITESVIKRFGVRFCDVNNAILFPYTDSMGEVLCLKARVPFTKKMFSLTPDLLGHPWLSFPSIQVSGAFFGMHLVRWEDPVTVVEGEIDMLRLASLGCENVLSAGTCTLSGRQIDSLHGVNYRIGLDSDLAGKKGSTKAVNMLRGRGVLVSTLDWSLVDCKDPGDLKDEQQLNVVLNKMAIAAW
jgi:DNA primase